MEANSAIRVMAEVVGLPWAGAVMQRLRETGWSIVKTAATHDPERLKEIAEAAKSGEGYATIARRYGITRQRVQQIASTIAVKSKRDSDAERRHEVIQYAIDNNLTVNETALHFEMNAAKVRSWAVKSGVRLARVPESKGSELASLAKLVSEGMSYIEAAGDDRSLAVRLSRYCIEHGITKRRNRRSPTADMVLVTGGSPQ